MFKKNKNNFSPGCNCLLHWDDFHCDWSASHWLDPLQSLSPQNTTYDIVPNLVFNSSFLSLWCRMGEFFNLNMFFLRLLFCVAKTDLELVAILLSSQVLGFLCVLPDKGWNEILKFHYPLLLPDTIVQFCSKFATLSTLNVHCSYFKLIQEFAPAMFRT